MKTYSLPGWLRVLLLIAIPVIALGMVALGFWQLSRLEQRRLVNAEIRARLDEPPLDLNETPLPSDLEGLEYRPAAARGTFDFENEIVWRNQEHAGAPGVHVITPLRLTGVDEAVLVDRGWIPYTEAEPAARRAYQSPEGELSMSGLLRLPARRTADFLPADPTLSPALPRLDSWFWLDIGQIQAQVPYALLPVIVAQTPGSEAPQLPIPSAELDLSEGPHLVYAVQWFAFAAIALVGPLLYWRRRA
jgi:surfeit locus 1 family protein